MVAAAMRNTGIMTIFDFILIVYGIYSITTARKMRQDHQCAVACVAAGSGEDSPAQRVL